MSHIAVRLIADFLADPDDGVNACAAMLPVLAGDAAPVIAQIYDETRHGWVARLQAPNDGSVTFPCLMVLVQDITDEADLPQPTPDGASIWNGSISVTVALQLEDIDSEDNARQAMYLMRAIRNCLGLLNHPKHVLRRRALGIELYPATSARSGRPRHENGDLMCSGAVTVQYPITETVLIP